jgi:putative tryptophan/tyrosine transport system substrate-binding protein
MRRREFLTLVGGAAATWPLVARAQQAARVARIGVLSPFSSADATLWHQAFLGGLRDLGWVDGKNLVIEYRIAEGKNDRLPALVAELIQDKVDLIVTAVTNDTLVAKNATKSIPIVMAAAGDPVGAGIVESLSRPGGNITGLSQMNTDLAAKRLALLKELSPKISSVAVFLNPDDPISVLGWNEMQPSAQKLGLEAHSFEVRTAGDFAKAFNETKDAHWGALAILPNPVFVTNMKGIADFALQNNLPAIFHLREFARAGGLVSYGVDRSDLYRRAATYVDKILKGSSPAALPIEQPTKFELTINLKTAKALSLTVPPPLLVTADEVIE